MKKINEKIKACLNCVTKPCQVGCPLNNDIPGFIKLLKENNLEKSYEVLSKTTVLPSICSRVCPYEKQCEAMCVKGISYTPVRIHEIEKYLGDLAIKENLPLKKYPKNKELKNKKVAIVGGGPAGLTCAAFLKRNGVDVTIYEKYKELGGLLVHGIPNFRLEREIVVKTIKKILDLGVKVEYERSLGDNLFLKDLEKEYDAVFLGIGSNVGNILALEGNDLQGVYNANYLLEKDIHLDLEGKRVAVIGGGDVSLDIARVLKREGAKKVVVVYRKGKKDMPSRNIEEEASLKEGIKFLFHRNLVKINGDTKVKSIEVVRTKFVKKNDNQLLINIPNSNYELKFNLVVFAIGSHVDYEVLEKSGLELNKGKLKINENNQTSNSKVFAGGDLTNNIKTVAWASKSGRTTALKILDYLKENML